MALPLYDALVAKVRDWSNRDVETLPTTIVEDALQYAADNTYRTLRVPALEATVSYTIPESDAGGECLTIPDDLTEFISLRRTDPGSAGYGGAGNVDNRTIVYDQKADYRTFRDLYDQQYSRYRWTRHENNIIVHPTYETDETYELHYYRRLPALNARYQTSIVNYNAGLLEQPENQDGSVGTPYYFTLGTMNPDYTVDTAYENEADVPPSDTGYTINTPDADEMGFTFNLAEGDPTIIGSDQVAIFAPDGTERGRARITTLTIPADQTTDPFQVDLDDVIEGMAAGDSIREVAPVTIYFQGREAPNWLRDEQEKVLIFGALSYVFSYLGEAEMEGKYQQRAQFEIDLLNEEEGKRRASGGNVQQNFNGYLI